MGGSTGGMVDVVRAGLASVRLGGTVAAGDPLTSDANGKAVKAVPARRSIAASSSPAPRADWGSFTPGTPRHGSVRRYSTSGGGHGLPPRSLFRG
jgi:hypothetical protein